ncbi:hypothetical protein H072_4517 [Dactylellina haptotyla CBS 200.50]|uniref:Uncharacterized protein n=1 Tax=Dactylellina haptotyla (strain CBS 200.50) TaxID=1284197 RepID=S8AK99_DACHA|nr:hypothetical protein H072_4517 [Dactylellina haptotyla CBS 200.50]
MRFDPKIVSLSTILLYAHHGIYGRFLRVSRGYLERGHHWETGEDWRYILEGDQEEFDDTSEAWVTNGCQDLLTKDPKSLLDDIEYYSGYPVNPEFPYFLKKVLIYGSLGCPHGRAVHEIHIEDLTLTQDEQPGWLRLAKPEYSKRLKPGNVAMEIPDILPKSRGMPPALARWPQSEDYRNERDFDRDYNQHFEKVSAYRGMQYIDKLAVEYGLNSPGNTEDLSYDGEYDAEWNQYGISEWIDIYGNASIRFVSDLDHWHVNNLGPSF